MQIYHINSDLRFSTKIENKMVPLKFKFVEQHILSHYWKLSDDNNESMLAW